MSISSYTTRNSREEDIVRRSPDLLSRRADVTQLFAQKFYNGGQSSQVPDRDPASKSRSLLLSIGIRKLYGLGAVVKSSPPVKRRCNNILPVVAPVCLEGLALPWHLYNKSTRSGTSPARRPVLLMGTAFVAPRVKNAVVWSPELALAQASLAGKVRLVTGLWA